MVTYWEPQPDLSCPVLSNLPPLPQAWLPDASARRQRRQKPSRTSLHPADSCSLAHPKCGWVPGVLGSNPGWASAYPVSFLMCKAGFLEGFPPTAVESRGKRIQWPQLKCWLFYLLALGKSGADNSVTECPGLQNQMAAASSLLRPQEVLVSEFDK